MYNPNTVTNTQLLDNIMTDMGVLMLKLSDIAREGGERGKQAQEALKNLEAANNSVSVAFDFIMAAK